MRALETLTHTHIHGTTTVTLAAHACRGLMRTPQLRTIPYIRVLHNIVQWNLSNPDTNGAEESVIVSEVSSFQRLKCMQEWYILGVGKGVLFREV